MDNSFTYCINMYGNTHQKTKGSLITNRYLEQIKPIWTISMNLTGSLN